MGQLRAALRAYAQDEKSPADIMRKLDEWVRSTAPVGAGGDPPTVSCIYLIYDAWSRELTFANAGHAAPLMAAGGVVQPLEIRHKGVLLGVRGRGIRGLPTYREQTVKLPPGAALVLYTDGLTDRRTRADGSGHYTEAEAVAMLRDAILAAANGAGGAKGGAAKGGGGAKGTGARGSGARGSGARGSGARGGAAKGDGIANELALAAENAVPGDIDDDMAILVFRSSPDDLASAERTFPAEPIMVSEARRLAASTFASWDMDPDQADLACLLVSEVVTNAVLHASVTPSPSGRRFEFEIDPPAAPVALSAPVPSALPSAWPAAATAVAAQTWDNPIANPMPAHRPREFVLRLRRGAEAIWVEVFDPDLRLPRLRSARATDEGGRGLYLVEQLATRWGSRPTPEGKTVWFEVPLDALDGKRR